MALEHDISLPEAILDDLPLSVPLQPIEQGFARLCSSILSGAPRDAVLVNADGAQPPHYQPPAHAMCLFHESFGRDGRQALYLMYYPPGTQFTTFKLDLCQNGSTLRAEGTWQQVDFSQVRG